LVILPYHSICEELLASLCPVGHQDRLAIVNRLAFLQERSRDTGPIDEDPVCIARLKAEARRLSASTFMT
jgi:hypothetical protein